MFRKSDVADIKWNVRELLMTWITGGSLGGSRSRKPNAIGAVSAGLLHRHLLTEHVLNQQHVKLVDSDNTAAKGLVQVERRCGTWWKGFACRYGR